ncbi:hypothetical protein M422DRAFT_245564 [Sphaerobolus stellatus SS14]|nr:hypothetical protein M422DRAFT_245564 [Sphaerobolus stellatus SS14]
MRTMHIQDWATFCDEEFLAKFTLDYSMAGAEDLCRGYWSWRGDNRFYQTEDDLDISGLRSSLRQALYPLLMALHQEISDLIRMAPNLGRVIIFADEGIPHHLPRRAVLTASEYRGLKPLEWVPGINSSCIAFGVQGQSWRNDPTQVILPTRDLLSVPLIGEPFAQQLQRITDLLAIDFPICYISMSANILCRIPRLALAKLQTAGRVTLHLDGHTLAADSTLMLRLQNIFKMMDDGQIEG